MTKPVRLQLSRRKGFNLQAASHRANGLEAVNVARPGKWGNLFVVGQHGTQAECVDLFAKLLGGLICCTGAPNMQVQIAYRKMVVADRNELHGKNLACWCKRADPCHADVLLELANRPTKSEAA